MLTPRIIFTITLILTLITACAQPAQTSGNAVVTSNAESIPGSKIDVPMVVRLDVLSHKADETVVNIFVQPIVDSPVTLITVTLPAEIQLLQGELKWEAKLLAKEIFTRTIIVTTKGITSASGLSAAGIQLHAVHLDVANIPEDADYSFGIFDQLFLRRSTDGSLEFSHDPYFGEPYCCPHGEPGEGIVTATPGGPTETPITETPGLPKFYVIQTMAPTLTWLATMSPPVTQPPGNLTPTLRPTSTPWPISTPLPTGNPTPYP